MVAPSIGPYRILEKIGAGGMGEVYLAEDSRLGRKVAIKTLPPSRLENPDARRRLLNEARTAATLNHPNIAAIYDVVEAEDRLHIVMEYAHGETLSARVGRGALRPAAVLDIALQLTDALAAAHEAGVVHRDLKSDNVLIHPNGRLKVLDFGLARLHSPGPGGKIAPEDTTPSGTRSISGTPPYMSPEQILGNRIDQRSDIYSLGVVLFELLTGSRPFEHKDGVSVAAEVLAGRVPSVRERNPYVPEELGAIVGRAMAREPAARYQSAHEMRADLLRLSAVLSDRPTMSHPVDWAPSPRAHTLPAQRPSGLAGALALAAAATALLALRPLAGRGSASGDGGSGRPPVVAVLPFVNLSNDRSDEPLGTGIADVLVSKLSRLHGVALLPLSATQPYHGRRDDPRRVAADLGATYVVEGRVQRAGEHLRVTATLVDGGSGKVAWSEDFDAGRADVFALQHQLADGLAAALRLRLSPAERQALAQPPTSNVEAFADYSQARSFLERWDIPGNIDRAIQLLQSAVTKDSRFALAHAALGEAYWKQWKQTRQAQWTVKARDSSAEALRLDPNQPAVHYAMATIYNDTGRLNEAAEELNSALSLQPNSDSAHVLFAQVLSRQGRSEEALAHLRTAVSLRPQLWDNHRALGLAYFDRGRYAEAAASFQRITELQPDSAWGFQMLGTVHHASGNFGAALSAYQEAVKRGGSGATYTNLGMLHSREGRYAEAARAYEDALKYPPLTPLRYRNLGDAYRQLGREKDARRRYQQAMELSWKMLEVNPRDGRTMAMLAVVEAKLGRLADARTHAIDASRLRPDDGDVFFRKCVVHTLAREPEAAITALREALTRGYSRTLVLEDDDLKPLRGLASFQALLEQPRS